MKGRNRRYLAFTQPIIWIALICLVQVQLSNAQCAFVGPVTVLPGQTQSFSLEVLGALNNDLSDPNQGICAVFLEFNHNLIGELQINLISPSGTVVNLVGPNAATNPTNLTKWNVAFLPCMQIASPDNGFSPIWSNNQPWGILGNFVGSYYPAAGCLEDFNSGPVNGFWQIQIVNSSLFNNAVLSSFAILFCDPDGLDCEICLAKGGDLSIADSSFCFNDSDLFLDIDLSYIGFRPDPNEYDYVYLIGQNGIVLDTLGVPDLRNYPSGVYEICGFSYLATDEMEIIGQVIGEELDFLKDTLSTSSPPFCASMSSNCLPVTISEPNDTTFVEYHICSGDSIVVEGLTFTETGVFTVDAMDGEGCDSIISIDLKKFILDGIPIPVMELSCQNTEVQLGLVQLITNFLPGEIEYTWFDEGMNILSGSEFLMVDSAGIYHLIIKGESNLVICTDTFTFLVTDSRISYLPEITLSGNFCINNTFQATIQNPIAGGNYIWTAMNGTASITEINNSTVVEIVFSDGMNAEICVVLDDPCYLTDMVCATVPLIQTPPSPIPADTSVCGAQVIFNISGLHQNGSFSFVNGPDQTFIIDQITDEEIGISVITPGLYQFQFESEINGCIFSYLVNITFSADLFATINPMQTTLCESDSVRLLINLPPGLYSVTLDIPGLGPIIFGNLENDTILSIDIPLDVFSIGLINVFPDGNPDCLVDISNQIQFDRFVLPDLSQVPDVSVCNQELESGLDTYVDFDQLSVGIGGTISFTNLEGIGSGSFPIIDFENVSPGSYSFLINSDYSGGLCPLAEDTIQVTVIDCACDDHSVSDDTTIVCKLNIVSLNQYKNHLNDGIWEILDAPAGSSINIGPGSLIDFSDQPPGLYQFHFTLISPKPLCPSRDTLYIEIVDAFSTGTFLTDSLRICSTMDSTLNLRDLLQSADSGGSWINSGGLLVPANALNPNTGQLSISGFAQGTYFFQYIPPMEEDCFEQTSAFRLIVEDPLTSDLPDTVYLNCDIINLDIGFLPANPQEYEYNWSTIGGMIVPGTEHQALLNVNSEGLYIVNLTNNINHCSLSDSVFVSELEQGIDTVKFQIIGPKCIDLNTGEIIIQQIVGGNPPYQIRAGSIIANSAMVISGLRSGQHTLEVTDADGCLWTQIVTIPTLDPYFIDIGPDQYGEIGDQFEIEFSTDVNVDEILNWNWSVNEIDTCQSCSPLVLQPHKTIPVVFSMILENGCILRDTMWIFLDAQFKFFFPDAFSPNADGINDLIQIFSADPNLKVEKFDIFDRWGNKVFASRSYYPALENIGWDGVYNGRDALPAVYTYQLILSGLDGIPYYFKGDFLLMR